MPHGVLTRSLKEVVEDLIHIEAVKVGQKLGNILVRRPRLGVLDGCVHLHAIAR